MRGPKKHWIGWKDCPQTWNIFWIAEPFSSDSVCSTDYFEFSAKKSFCLLRYLDFSCQMSCHTIRCWLAHIWQKWASIIYTYNKCHTGKMLCLYYCLVIITINTIKGGPFWAPLCTCTSSKQSQNLNLTPRSTSILFIFLQSCSFAFNRVQSG